MKFKDKTYVMKLKPEPFRMILSGVKDIELRLYDEKRKEIKIDDTVLFTETESGETTKKTVANLIIKNNLNEIFDEEYTKQRAGCDSEQDDVDTQMSKYYLDEDKAGYGVVGIVLG